MTDLSAARRRYAQALDEALEKLTLRMKDLPAVHRVVLFGSAAAGRRDLTTDLDVLVVMDSDEDFVTRTASLYRDLGLGVDADVLAYTPAEMREMADTPWMRRILREGKTLYEKDAG